MKASSLAANALKTKASRKRVLRRKAQQLRVGWGEVEVEEPSVSGPAEKNRLCSKTCGRK